MIGNILPVIPSTPPRIMASVTIDEVIPVRVSERCSCSYCGQVKRVAYRIGTNDGSQAVVCYPCSDRGMHWLEQNFPIRPV